MAFLKSLKTLFEGQEVEIIVKSVEPNRNELSKAPNKLLEMIKENREKAPVIAKDVDIRSIIDESGF